MDDADDSMSELFVREWDEGSDPDTCVVDKECGADEDREGCSCSWEDINRGSKDDRVRDEICNRDRIENSVDA